VQAFNADQAAESYSYDANGNLVETLDRNQHGVVRTYDALNRLAVSLDHLGGTTAIQYSRADQITRVTAPNSAQTDYRYNLFGETTQEVSPDRGTLTYRYDAAGNLIERADARNITATLGYDALNRITRLDYPGSDEDVVYEYDTCPNGIGRLCRIQDGSGEIRYRYDLYGNRTEQQTLLGGVTYTTGYTYDDGDQVASMTYPDGSRVDYQRDDRGRISAILMTQSGITQPVLEAITYNALGQRTGGRFGNGLIEQRQYDLNGRLVHQWLYSADGQIVEQRAYTHDDVGNVTSQTTDEAAQGYTYDALDRLIASTREEATSTLAWAYSYDANGNRLTRTDGLDVTGYSYEPNSNRMATRDGAAVVIDEAGNTREDGTGLRFEYNQAGRMVSAYRGMTLVGEYRYNALGQRTWKRTQDGEIYFHYNLSGQPITESDALGQLAKQYVWMGMEPVAQLEARADGSLRVTYLHTDHLATPRIGSDDQARMVWQWEGEAFGDESARIDEQYVTAAESVNVRFPGQYFDSETGLHYNYFRDYEPSTGRYIEFDPIGLAGGTNPFIYVNANPLRFIDQDGLRYSPYEHGMDWDGNPVNLPQPLPPDSDYGPTLVNCAHYPPGSTMRGICEISGDAPDTNCVRKCLKDLYPDYGACPPQKDDPWFTDDHPFCWRYCDFLNLPVDSLPPLFFEPFDGR